LPGESRCNIVFLDKENGYRGFHFDTVSESGNPLRALPFEIQVKTPEWSDIANHGKAAHYYYLGGDTDFVDMIKASYNDIIRRDEGGKKSNSMPPPSR
jgi:(p)ppGpp synthase/HD superfamily hydrolase